MRSLRNEWTERIYSMMNTQHNGTDQPEDVISAIDDAGETQRPAGAAETPESATADVAAPSPSESPVESQQHHSADGQAGGDAQNSTAIGISESVEGMELRPVLEAILFSTDAPISVGKLAQTVGLDSTKPIKIAINELNEIYGQRQAAYRIEERAGGYQLLTLPQYAQCIQRLTKARDEGRLTPAALETLAIIAYRQPILRVDVESIRGVACGEVIRTLMEYNLVKIVGRAEEIGRPMLYGTTRHFLEVFGLSSLKDLPNADQLKEPKAAG